MARAADGGGESPDHYAVELGHARRPDIPSLRYDLDVYPASRQSPRESFNVSF
jgi:hypothetical protein